MSAKTSAAFQWPSFRSVLWGMLLLLYAVAIVKGVALLAYGMSFPLRGGMDVDVNLYFMVGRSMLNGLQPYVDLFETKPPFVFLLAALSLLISPSGWTFNALSAMGLASPPLLLFAFAWVQTTKPSMHLFRKSLLCLAVVLGLLLSLYMEFFIGVAQPEGLGILFAAMYIIAVLLPVKKPWPLVLQSVFLLLAIQMKDSFFFTLLAAAIVLAGGWKQFITIFVVPLILGSIGAGMFLLFFGLLSPYLTVYIPTMAMGRMGYGATVPPVISMLEIRPLFYHLQVVFAATPLFAPLMLFLWSCVPLYRSGAATVMALITSLATAATGFVLLRSVGLLFAVGVLESQGMRMSDAGLLSTAQIGLILGVPLFLLFGWLQYRQRLLRHTFAVLAPIYCIAYAAAAGGYSGKHFALAFPLYFACAALFIRYIATHRNPLAWGIASSLAISSLLLYADTPEHIHHLQESLGSTYATTHAVAEKIDTIMNACDVDRYYPPVPFTRHSPWGPIPVFSNHQYLPKDNPLIQQTVRNLSAGNLLFVTSSDINPIYADFVRKRFTRTPPPCAKDLVPVGDYELWFRQS